MGSRSDPILTSGRPRPTVELLARLRAGKADLRARRMALPLRDKIAQLLELQRIQYPLMRRQRPLREWERPWEVEP